MRYLIISLLLLSCNPVKRVLRDPEKTLVVVAAYLKNYPIKSDTLYNILPGDTIVNSYYQTDTSYVADTIHKPVETIITRYLTKTITQRDTLVKTIVDRNLQTILQQQLYACNAVQDQLKLDNEELAGSRNKFRLWFWLLIAALSGSGALWAYIKLKS